MSLFMRFFLKYFGCFLFLSLSILTQLQAGAWLDAIDVRYEKAETFKRISEYLTGKEYQGNRVIVRFPETERAGMYWVCQLKQSTALLPPKTRLKVSYFKKGSGEMKWQSFELSNKRNVPTVFAGITGDGWKESEAMPSAWRVDLIDQEGNILDSQQSFLWELPKK